MTDCYLGLDLGGTNAKYGLVDAAGRIIKRGRLRVQAERGPEPIISDLIRVIEELRQDLPEGLHPRGLAVGAAGLVLPREGLLVRAPNLPGWSNVPLAQRLSQALDIEVRLMNDADLFTLGEWLAGAGRGLGNMVGLTLGTGVGGGLILDGRIWNGPHGGAGEVGHIIVDPQGRPCGCGSRGCLETLASATGIVETARQLIASGVRCSFEGNPADLTARVLSGLARAGDQVALEAFETAGRAIGIVLTGIFNLLGLEGVVMGGGASTSFDLIFPALWSEFQSRVFAVAPETIRIVPAALGDDAPLAGAPALFQKNFCWTMKAGA
ncbi:MAG: ROK family protein [Pseudomonadota bacterium]